MVTLHQGNLFKEGKYSTINIKIILHCHTEHCTRKLDVRCDCGQCARVLSMKSKVKAQTLNLLENAQEHVSASKSNCTSNLICVCESTS